MSSFWALRSLHYLYSVWFGVSLVCGFCLSTADRSLIRHVLGAGEYAFVVCIKLTGTPLHNYVCLYTVVWALRHLHTRVMAVRAHLSSQLCKAPEGNRSVFSKLHIRGL